MTGFSTEENRFRKYFERQKHAYLDCAYGKNSKFGQHPTGFYLEEYGPDGNYDKLNQFSVARDYLIYQKIKNPDPVLLEKMKKGIEKNLFFTSLFCLEEPDGNFYSPNAFNCRTTGLIGNPGGYPGNYVLKSIFPMAAAKFLMTRPPQEGGPGVASTFTFLANNPQWINATLQQLKGKGVNVNQKEIFGHWIPSLVNGYRLPTQCSPEKLPTERTNEIWDIPGLFSWKKGEFYGVIFYDVDGADRVLKGYFGGGLTALWTKATGTLFSSMQPSLPNDSHPRAVSGPSDLTYSSVYGLKGDGKFFASGKERSKISFLSDDKTRFEITTQMRDPSIELKWNYEILDNQVNLSVSATPNASLKSLNLNLPLVQKAKVKMTLSPDGKSISLNSDDSTVLIESAEKQKIGISPSVLPDIKRMVIPLQTNGDPLSISIKTTK